MTAPFKVGDWVRISDEDEICTVVRVLDTLMPGDVRVRFADGTEWCGPAACLRAAEIAAAGGARVIPLAAARWTLLRMAARELRCARDYSAAGERVQRYLFSWSQVAAFVPDARVEHRRRKKLASCTRKAWAALERAARYVEQARAVGEAADPRHRSRDPRGRGAVSTPFKVGAWVAHVHQGLVGRVIGYADPGAAWGALDVLDVAMGSGHVTWYEHNVRAATPAEIAAAKGTP